MSDGDRRADALLAALQRLRSDLGARLPVGAWPRGVVGATVASGAVRHGYPESAGYWLHWASRRDDIADDLGAAVVDWLRQRERSDGWPTRVGATRLDPAYGQASYLFDHVMLWHGLQQWGRVRGLAPALALGDRARQHARQFIADGALVAARGLHSGRWSGRGGPFLLKVCARARHGDDDLGAASRRALPTLVDAALAQPHAEAHPQLYAIEGLIELGERAAATTALRALIAAHAGIGFMREAVDAGPRRSDVLAQLLRAALLLDLADRGDADWSALATELALRVEARGRLPFAAPGDDCPTWAALFAEQALSLWCGQSLPDGGLV
jgi:hypothetical protein